MSALIAGRLAWPLGLVVVAPLPPVASEDLPRGGDGDQEGEYGGEVAQCVPVVLPTNPWPRVSWG
jgi:hypothetical protein